MGVSLDQLAVALKNADAAGDTVAATKLAGAIKTMQGGSDRFSGAFDTSADKPDAILGGPSSNFGDRFDAAATFGLSKDAGALAHAVVSSGANLVSGQPVDFGRDYQEGRNVETLRQNAYAKYHPQGAAAADVAGTLGSIAATAPVQATAAPQSLWQLVKEGAKGGAAIGGLAGLGESDGSPLDRLGSAAGGAVMGAGIGGVAAPVAEGASQLAQKYVVNPIRGLFNPEAEAARRVLIARQADQEAGQGGISAADQAAATANGQPVLNIDRGGETTSALARSAANTSPVGRAALTQAVDDRFATQGDRTVDMVRRIVGTNTTADTRDALQTAARNANRPAYAAAYNAPAAQGVWDSSLEQLATAPIVQDAIKQASVTGRNAGALNGFAPIKSPFKIDAAGHVALGTDAQGNTVLPNLQFWDHVKRNLDAVGTREAQQASRVLRDHLDQIVPSYATARAGAAKFFGAKDALEAGDQFVMSRMANNDARQALGKMSPPERQLFSEGFADSLTRRVSEVGDRRAVINSLFLRSPASRERINLALGPQKAKELETFIRVEDLMDKARKAVTGNSTTARQLMELGIAGGSGIYGMETGDWKTSAGVIAALLARRGMAGIDRRVAQKVAEMLASPDPSIVHKGVQLVAKNGPLLQALRSVGTVTGARQAPTLQPLQLGAQPAAQ